MKQRGRASWLVGSSDRTIRLAVSSGAAGALATFTVHLLLLPYVLHHLGDELYGAWTTVVALLAVASLADAGIRTEIARRVAIAHGQSDRANLQSAVHQGTTVLAALVLPTGVLALLLTPALVTVVFPQGVPGYPATEIVALVRALLLVMLVNLVLGAYYSALKGLQRSDVTTFAQISALPVNAGLLVVGLQAGWGLWALFWALTAGTVTTLGVQWVAARRIMAGVGFALTRVSKPMVLSYLSLSGLALLSQIGDVVDSQWDKLVLSRYVGANAVTAFHIGTSLVLQGKALALLPIAPLLVVMAELQWSRPEHLKAVQTRLVKFGAVATCVVLGGTFVFIPSFIELWLGAGYGPSGNVARIFVVAVVINLVGAPMAFQAFAQGQHTLAALSAVTNMVVNSVLSLVFTIHFGLYGAVYGSVVGTAAGTALLLTMGRRRLEHSIRPPLAGLMLTSLVVVLIVWFDLDDHRSWWSLIVGITIYAVTIALAAARIEGVSLRRNGYLPDRS